MNQSQYHKIAERQLGKIHCLENSKFEDNKGQDKPVIILFHGYGADAYDLYSLSDVIQPSVSCDFLFPQGVIEVPVGPGWTGRAWWPIDLAQVQKDTAEGKDEELLERKPPSLPKLRDQVFEAIKQLRLPWNKIIIGGFSQGSMLATDIAMNAPENPLGLIILSGAMINREEWTKKVTNRKGLKFFMSHGQSDPVLPIRGAQQLETLLTTNGLVGRLQSFKGTHEIPMHIIQELNNFLKKLF